MNKGNIIRFIIAGSINTFFGLFIFSVFHTLGIEFKISYNLAILSGVIFNYFTYSYFVFRKKNVILKFITSYAFLLTMQFFIEDIAAASGISNIYITYTLFIITPILTFLILKYYVYIR